MQHSKTTQSDKFWRRLVENYSDLKLNLETDKLPAFSGIAVAITHSAGNHLAGLWSGLFCYGTTRELRLKVITLAIIVLGNVEDPLTHSETPQELPVPLTSSTIDSNKKPDINPNLPNTSRIPSLPPRSPPFHPNNISSGKFIVNRDHNCCIWIWNKCHSLEVFTPIGRKGSK
jgi:hypothetical protein